MQSSSVRKGYLPIVRGKFGKDDIGKKVQIFGKIEVSLIIYLLDYLLVLLDYF